jgi:hypothetical protein
MNKAVEMGSGAMIYIPSFIKIGSGIQKWIGGGIHRCTNKRVITSLLLFFLKYEKLAKCYLKAVGKKRRPVDYSSKGAFMCKTGSVNSLKADVNIMLTLSIV